MIDRPVLQRSVNTERALAAPRPRLRGTLHLVAAVITPVAGIVWIADLAPGRPRWSVAAFVVGISAMFAASAVLHLRRWTATTYERLFRLDHTGIYLAIGGTGVALAFLGLVGLPRMVLMSVAVGGTLTGILIEWLPFAPPRGFSNSVYLTLGWVPMLLLPWLWITSGVVAVGLLFLGGVLYTSGAIMLALRRPDPWPDWFGYHELWHLLVVVAVASHALMLARLAG